MTKNEMKKKLAEMVVKAKDEKALELVQRKMELLGITDLNFDEEETEKVTDQKPWEKEGISRGTWYRRKAEETACETSVETVSETTDETACETVENTTPINTKELVKELSKVPQGNTRVVPQGTSIKDFLHDNYEAKPKTRLIVRGDGNIQKPKPNELF